MHECDAIDSVVPNLNPINDRKNENSPITACQWMTVGILCFVNLINYMDRYTIAGILTKIQAYFKLGDDEGGLLQTAFVLSYMLFAPFFGYLGDRYSRRYIMAFGVFLWSLTTLIGSFMKNYYWFLTFRTLVGIGEASYSTIAPTIISDLFIDDMRSKMLSLFYFAIPVGSGLGYIIGAETAELAGSWQWGLRVTPVLGAIAVLLILFILDDPVRGSVEGVTVHRPTTWKQDILSLLKNKSFMLSTGGFTCVAFVTGALAWWGPHYILLGLHLQPGNENDQLTSVSFKFGLIAMFAGLIGVPLGSLLATRLRPSVPRIDPILCAVGLLTSAPLIFAAIVVSKTNTTITYILIFFGQVALNLNWAIVADILLYVVPPPRRSTAEAFQILLSHALGDAGSPYLIGVLSEVFKRSLSGTPTLIALYSLSSSALPLTDVSPELQFKSFQYALFTTCFVEVLGGFFFLLTTLYITEDRAKAEVDVSGIDNPGAPTHMYADDPALNCSVANLTT